jgi:hypothetical protein
MISFKGFSEKCLEVHLINLFAFDSIAFSPIMLLFYRLIWYKYNILVLQSKAKILYSLNLYPSVIKPLISSYSKSNLYIK